MNKIMKLLDGKKTLLGSILIVVGTAGAPVFGIPVAVAGLLTAVGTMLGGAGVVHKALKAEDEGA